MNSTKQAGSSIPRIRRYSVFLLMLAGIILIPAGVVLSGLFLRKTEIWSHILGTLLGGYFLSTAGLAAGVLLLSSVIGVTVAWLVVFYDFPFKKILSTALVIPMAIPAYISAFTYAGILDYTGPVQMFFRNTLHWQEGYPVVDIMNLPGAVFVMTMALYPYIYLPVRSSFRQQAGTVYEAARTLGVSGKQLFFRISLPLIRPALAAGSVLALMEVLNEYGAVHYFGVNTLTVGIFRAWFSLGDLGAAKKLAALLLLTVFTIILAEKALRGRIGYSMPVSGPHRSVPVTGWKAVLIIVLCLVPVLLGFLVPVAQLIFWSVQAGQSPFSPFYLRLTLNSFLLTGLATLIILTAAIAAAHILRNRSLNHRKFLASLMTLGYAVPGAVIAIGIMSAFGFTDRMLNLLVAFAAGLPGRLFLSGSFAALFIAYGIRYLGVAFNPVEAGFSQVSRRIHEASRMLGRSGLSSLFQVDLPNIPSALTAGFILVFIDIMKELPLTMILRPFNFDTLAVRAYEMAGDEQLSLAALPSLVIVLTGLIPVFLLIGKKDNRSS